MVAKEQRVIVAAMAARVWMDGSGINNSVTATIRPCVCVLPALKHDAAVTGCSGLR